VAAWPLAVSGCGVWDEFRSEDYSIKKTFFTHEDPLVVLADPKVEGNKRARALGALREPLEHGGTKEQQDFVVNVLVTAARTDPQMWCRLKAIESLSQFKDVRAVRGLRDAYYEARNFVPHDQTVLRVQVLTALGKIGNPEALDLLVSVLKAPPAEESANTDEDQQLFLDQRIAAAQALQHFKNYQAVEALALVLKTDKDTALRNSATESLQVATGKKLPAEYDAWDQYLHPQNGGRGAADAIVKQKKKPAATILPVVGSKEGPQSP
jgi:hypothetical protein